MSQLPKILIIDDNAKLIADTLPMYGYDVKVAGDGLLGLKLLDEDKNFDLIVLDVVMPNLDGWKTLKAIRNNPDISKIPVIMLTSVDDMSKQVTGLKFGADDYIVKPFKPIYLKERIAVALDASLER